MDMRMEPTTADAGELVEPWLTDDEAARLAMALADSRAASTRTAYASKWRSWERWCHHTDRQALPADPGHVAVYLTELAAAGRSLSTINGAAAAIRAKHEDAGHEDPTAVAGVRRVRAGLTRRLGKAPKRKAHPISLVELRRMLETCDIDGIRGLRDRALLLVGYAGALRRSELADLEVSGIARARDGVVLTLDRSKGDQDGEGQHVGITRGLNQQTCPVTALMAWLDVLGTDSGPLFCRITRHNTAPVTVQALSGSSVDQIVRARAACAGLGDLRISGHSLRAGHATTAAENGVDAARIARTTRHVRLETLAGYIRPAEVLRDTTARELGL